MLIVRLSISKWYKTIFFLLLRNLHEYLNKMTWRKFGWLVVGINFTSHWSINHWTWMVGSLWVSWNGQNCLQNSFYLFCIWYVMNIRLFSIIDSPWMCFDTQNLTRLKIPVLKIQQKKLPGKKHSCQNMIWFVY